MSKILPPKASVQHEPQTSDQLLSSLADGMRKMGIKLEDAPDHPGGMRLCVNPFDNVLVGSQALLRYLGIASITTLYEWVELYGLPAIKRPDGMWMSTMTAIDTWVFLGAQIDLANRPHSRGNSHRHDEAAELIEARFGPDARQTQMAQQRSREAQANGGVGKKGAKSNWTEHPHEGDTTRRAKQERRKHGQE